LGQILPPGWNRLPFVAAIAGSTGPALAIAGIWYYFSPWYTDVGDRPVQPVSYNHALHVGERGLDGKGLLVHRGNASTASFHQNKSLNSRAQAAGDAAGAPAVSQ